MKEDIRILIGGQAMLAYGSTRGTKDVDYLVDSKNIKDIFYHDTDKNIDYINANGNEFFRMIFDNEKNNDIASPQSMLELKAYAWVQHFQNGNYRKASACEFDIRYLVSAFGLMKITIANRFMRLGEFNEVMNIIRGK